MYFQISQVGPDASDITMGYTKVPRVKGPRIYFDIVTQYK